METAMKRAQRVGRVARMRDMKSSGLDLLSLFPFICSGG